MSLTIRDGLRHLMRRDRLTQAQLAKQWRVTQPTISRWLRGTRRPRQQAVRHALLDLGVDPRCL